jgi:pimeloyl-ACP methyl ester carboxylesterase
MTIEFAFSSDCDSPQSWIWFPGWGFKAEVFTDLARSLPGQHYWYRWSDHQNFDSAVNEICELLPKDAILVGWSLGGAIAHAAAQRLTSCTALITLATPSKFCPTKHEPLGMTQIHYKNFVSDFKVDHRKALFRFLALNAQGAEKPKSIIRFLSQYQLKSSDALFHQLLWLDQYDLTDANMEANKPEYPCLHIFAQHDALVIPPKEYKQGRDELIPSTCHAFFIQQPQTIKEYCLNIYAKLNFA